MGLAEAVQLALTRMLSEGRVEVRENGAWLAALEGFGYDVRQQNETALLHLWSRQQNQVRRVTRVVREDPDRLALEVARLGGRRPARLEFLAARRSPPSGRVLREQFRVRFQEMLARKFPDETVVSLTAAPDLEHSLSGSYVRGVLRGSSGNWAVLGAAPGENAAVYDGLLTFGLIWLDHARDSLRPGSVRGLRLFVPEGKGRAIAHRFAALSPSVVVALHEYDLQGGQVRTVVPDDIGNVGSWLAQRREIEAALSGARSFLETLPPHVPDAIRAHVVPGTSQVELRYRGLNFARWQPDAFFFGIGEPQQLLSPERQPQFEKLLGELDTHRSPVADTSHRLYRAQPERWLESLVAADPSRVDPRLNPGWIYSQVPALTSGDRGVMDLLGVARDGRLTVLELKAQEDIHLPLQAADYWLRVRWHHERQDFSRYGYFPGVALSPDPPRLLLVAPSLRFHSATDIILRYLNPQIEIERVGVSEQWRRGIKVVLRQGTTSKARAAHAGA
jgi:hypothetical protein